MCVCFSFFSKYIFFTRLHAALFVLLCFFLVVNSPHADEQKYTVHATFHLRSRHIYLTHGQPASCRARPTDVDGDFEDIRRVRGLVGERFGVLEDIRWVRGLVDEILPAASYALLPNPTRKSIFSFSFCHPKEVEVLCRLFFLTAAASLVLFYPWSAPRHISPAIV